MIIDRKQLTRKIKAELKTKKQVELAAELKLNAMTINRIVHDSSKVTSILTWEKIAKHYHEKSASA